MQLTIVSGLSGSGKTVALHMLEDLGYYVIDNLPLALLERLVHDALSDTERAATPMAVGIDARSRAGDLAGFGDCVQRLRGASLEVQTVFLQADRDIILKRYNETRRPHPLAGPDIPLAEAVERERQVLAPVAEHADLVLDTSRTTMPELRDLVCERIGRRGQQLSLLFKSFGYKHGLPTDADFVFDVRCLPNPHWRAELRALTGRDADVAHYLADYPGTAALIADIESFLHRWLPAFETGSRSYVTVAVGCTGGQHRSVYVVEQLAAAFGGGERRVSVRHGELGPRFQSSV